MKKIFKQFLLLLLAAFVAIQFFRPTKNSSTGIGANDITTKYNVPDNVQVILSKSCNDCHSNNTVYPWYAEIQPIAWWLNDHIVDGKNDLNFSIFTSYSARRQYRKMEEVAELVKSDKMPLSSYTLIHKNAVLKDEQKTILYNWVEAVKDSIVARYPPDSLVKKK